MAYMVLDLKEEVSFVFKCKSDASKKIGVSVWTLGNWKKKGIIKYEGYLIDCNCDIVKCEVRNREGGGNIEKKN